MNIQLMGNRVLVKPIEQETAMGFIVPEAYREYRLHYVVAVGNGVRKKDGKRHPIPLEVGEKVVLSTDFRMPITIEGENYFLVSDEKVMAVIP